MTRVALCVVAVAVAACSKKSEPAVVARLEESVATVERMPREAAPWAPAKVGHTFVIGSAVRTGANSRARLKVGKTGKLDVDANAVVYFTRTPGRARDDVRVETGSIVIETGDEAVGFGEAVIDPHARAEVAASDDGVQLVVKLGRVVLEDDTVLTAGQQVTIERGGGRPVVDQPAVDAGSATVATTELVVTVTGAPARVEAPGGARELAPGEHPLEVGTAVTVPAGSTVGVARGGARATSAGPSKLRITEGPSLVEMLSGSVALDAEAADAVAIVKGGTVTANQGGAATVTVDGGVATVDAQRGETVVIGRDPQTLAAGESASLRGDGTFARLPAPPARTVAALEAGESAVLHDVNAPTPIRIAFGAACPRGGTLEIAKDRAFKRIVARAGGATGANALVPAGSFAYRVRCPGNKGASGSLRVVKDSGRTPLPKTAAKTLVEMDGREYTILYQNLLPELTLSWKNAPRKSRFVFVIKGRGGEKKHEATTARLTLPAGALAEGTYQVWVAPEGAVRSEVSRLVIEFDNAASSASIDRVELDGGKIRVKGTVIDGSTVSAGGTSIPLDRHRRFDTELAPKDDEDGVGVRIAHPKAGIHYYVMRAGPT